MNLMATILGLATIAWLAFEILLTLRHRGKAKDKKQNNRGSGYFNFIAIIVGLVVGGNLSGLERFYFPGGRTITVFIVGCGLMILGFAIRLWAILVLGTFFSTSLETRQGQQVIKHGPYKYVRHPSYAGAILICCGFGIAVQNWLSLAIVVLLPLLAFLYRIKVEERLMVSSFGSDYREYQKHTKRLVPWIW